MRVKPHQSLALVPLIVVGWLCLLPDADATSGDSAPFPIDTRNFADSTPLFEVDTHAPDLIANTGITDPGGTSFTITMVMLMVTGGGDGMDAITFTLVTAPTHGTLRLNGTIIIAGAMFTQADVDGGLLVYERAAGDSLTDTFELSAVDEANIALFEGSFTFAVAGIPGASGTVFLLDTRNFTASADHTVHTDNRAYLTADTVPGSLRQAIANAAAGDTVDFDAGLDGGTITLGGTQLLVDKDLIIDGSVLTGGVAVSGHNASRVFEIATGAIVTMKTLRINGGNSSAGGGGIFNAGTLHLSDFAVVDNESNDIGGGIWNTASSGNLILVNGIIAGNSARGFGGGISTAGGSLSNLVNGIQLRNVTVSGNQTTANLSSQSFGGGIHQQLSFVTMIHCTIAGNSIADAGAFGGGGGMMRGSGDLHIEHSIVAGNVTAVSPNQDLQATVTTHAGVNLVGDPTGASGLGTIGIDYLSGDPLLAPLGDYGGRTDTKPPLPGSPVIEAGILLAGTPATDQRGTARPSGPQPDLGAVEAFAFSTLPLVDTDDDGIDDRLEAAYGLVVGNDDSGVDSDDDGSPDAEELANMTDPDDPTDSFRILAFAPAAGFDPVTNTAFDVTLRTFPGLGYALETDDTLQEFQLLTNSAFIASDHAQNLEVILAPGQEFLRAKRD